jgi:hypothetical protein
MMLSTNDDDDIVMMMMVSICCRRLRLRLLERTPIKQTSSSIHMLSDAHISEMIDRGVVSVLI